MPRHYFRLTDGAAILKNHEGIDLAGDASARDGAIAVAHHLKYDAAFLHWWGSRNSISNVRDHCSLGRLFGLKGVDQDLGGRSGRGRVLARDQRPVGDNVDTPVFDLGESGTEAE